ncbi:MAG TPA: gluconolaconase [Mycobacteriales bacterium]|jgi:glucose/arabinose dehydrogenase|nr:gluconolaconase [Mycobacteriales bacterium]
MRRSLVPVAVLSALLAAGCAGSSGTPAAAGSPAPPTARAAAVSGPATLVPATVSVPAGFRQAPFDVPRKLNLPAGWTASVYTRIPGARFLSYAGGSTDLLVSQPSTGSVQLVRTQADGTGRATPWLTGLHSPHDIVPVRSGTTTWVYVAESDRVARYPWTAGAATAGPGQVVVTGLPDGGHALKNIAVVGGALYVSIGSSCNVCASDTTSTPQRAAIYRYPLTGGTGTLVATGLRNAEGLAEVPGTGALWAVTNNRDQIAYPRHGDITGDGKDDYGAVVPAYVDDHPMEPFVQVRTGAFYGWPFCNGTQDTAAGSRDMPLEADAETNADGHVNCAAATRIDLGIQAHSAPLGLTFLQRTAVPAGLRTGAAVALHGSWNRTRRTGYKVVWFDWQGTAGGGRPGTQRDLVTGWVSADGQDVWGRPVDVAADASGSLLVTDDQSGTVYRLSPPR